MIKPSKLRQWLWGHPLVVSAIAAGAAWIGAELLPKVAARGAVEAAAVFAVVQIWQGLVIWWRTEK